ncbi:MAG: response regulator [Helicobacteraceae bacterium]|jgi:YesN/AraC family two-component response regulator|nr:response regulator [Helicobacteraceae bacterium]
MNFADCAILFADDDDETRAILSRMLARRAKQVWVARDGKEALEMFQKEPCDILITDVQMPNINGIELVREVNKLRPGFPCLILSGYNEGEFSLDVPNVSWLVKPVNILQLQDLVEKLLA